MITIDRYKPKLFKHFDYLSILLGKCLAWSLNTDSIRWVKLYILGQHTGALILWIYIYIVCGSLLYRAMVTCPWLYLDLKVIENSFIIKVIRGKTYWVAGCIKIYCCKLHSSVEEEWDNFTPTGSKISNSPNWCLNCFRNKTTTI